MKQYHHTYSEFTLAADATNTDYRVFSSSFIKIRRHIRRMWMMMVTVTLFSSCVSFPELLDQEGRAESWVSWTRRRLPHITKVTHQPWWYLGSLCVWKKCVSLIIRATLNSVLLNAYSAAASTVVNPAEVASLSSHSAGNEGRVRRSLKWDGLVAPRSFDGMRSSNWDTASGL